MIKTVATNRYEKELKLMIKRGKDLNKLDYQFPSAPIKAIYVSINFDVGYGIENGTTSCPCNFKASTASSTALLHAGTGSK